MSSPLEPATTGSDPPFHSIPIPCVTIGPDGARLNACALEVANQLMGGSSALEELARNCLVGPPRSGDNRVVLAGRDGPVEFQWSVGRLPHGAIISLTVVKAADAAHPGPSGLPGMYERLIEILPVALFTKDPQDDFRITRVNRCFEETFGVRRSDIIGKTDRDLFPPDLSELYREHDLGIFEQGEVRVIEEEIETARGLRAARTIKAPLYSKDGRPEVLLGILQDVEDYRRAMQAAEEASTLKSSFLARTSHELRTPLYGIMGMIDIAMSELGERASGTSLPSAQACAQTLLATINDILDLSKIEAGKAVTHSELFNLKTLLETTVETLQHYAEGAGVQLGLRVVGDNRADWYSASYRGDAQRLRQILNNLLSNAVKFSPTDGTVDVAVSHRRSKTVDQRDWIRVEVHDRGVGIATEDLENIFGAFQQSESTRTETYAGTGLGLTIVQQMVELLEGRIGVESESGVGSTFWFELPLLMAEEDVPAPEDTGEEGSESKPVTSLHVLVAEDNPVNQRIIDSMLQRAGHRLSLACNGVEALETFCAEPSAFDMVLMDIQMPIMGGHEVIRAIREFESSRPGTAAAVPIIALTANAMAGDDKLCYEAGATGYLTKPMTLEQLQVEMARVLKLASTRRWAS